MTNTEAHREYVRGVLIERQRCADELRRTLERHHKQPDPEFWDCLDRIESGGDEGSPP